MIHRIALLAALLVVWSSTQVSAQFKPPRTRYVINPASDGLDNAAYDLATRRYYIDRGQSSNINKGDTLNVYREKRVVRGPPVPMRVFIGTMLTADSQQSSSVGRFEPNEIAIAHPMIRHKTAMTSDIVVPTLVIDNSVLFDPGVGALKSGAAEEFAKVAEFVQMFSPSKLVIDGHTDSDGDDEANLNLSFAARDKRQELADYGIRFYYVTDDRRPRIWRGTAHHQQRHAREQAVESSDRSPRLGMTRVVNVGVAGRWR